MTNLDTKESIISNEIIKTKIHTIRDLQVMLDSDLAELYGVELKRMNEQVKRNIERFPENFRFQLTELEKNELVAKCDHLENLKFSASQPYAFTEQGVAMLSAILKSNIAIKVSVNIINIFVNMRRILSSNNQLFQRLEQIEKRQISYELKSDEKEIYHIGASLKDLGKKWFAFSKLDIEALDMLSKIKGN